MISGPGANQLDYETPVQWKREALYARFLRMLARDPGRSFGIAIGAIGVLILLAAMLTRSAIFARFGLVWLMIGGALTALLVLILLVEMACKLLSPYSDGDVRRVTKSLLIVLLNFPLAIGCALVGIRLFSAGWMK